MYTYFSENNIPGEQQYGFRKQHSTELASIKLVDYIIKQMDNVHGVKTSVAIFCDLSKAFDCLTLSGPGGTYMPPSRFFILVT